jgi:outer membrane protein insertion porin family
VQLRLQKCQVSSESLSKLLTLSTGNIFERKKIIDSLKAITDLYTNQGYAFAKIDALTSEGEVANIINLKFKVSVNSILPTLYLEPSSI